MPLALRSLAIVTPAWLTADLEHLYAIKPPLPLSLMLPMSEVMMAILDPSRMCGTTALATRTGPTTFTSNASLRVSRSRPSKVCASVCSSQVCPGFEPIAPALFTRTSTVTPSSAARRTSAHASSVTSTPGTIFATPTASSSGFERRHVAYTASPRATSCLHSSSPMPELAPVTKTVGMRNARRGRRDRARGRRMNRRRARAPSRPSSPVAGWALMPSPARPLAHASPSPPSHAPLASPASPMLPAHRLLWPRAQSSPSVLASLAQQFKIVKITKTIKNPWGMSLINEKKLTSELAKEILLNYLDCPC